MKSKGIAYFLWFFLGWAGIHRFYVGKVVTGLLYLFTFGLLGFGWFIDLFLLSGYVDMYNVLHKSQNGFIVNNNITISSPNDGFLLRRFLIQTNCLHQWSQKEQ